MRKGEIGKRVTEVGRREREVERRVIKVKQREREAGVAVSHHQICVTIKYYDRGLVILPHPSLVSPVECGQGTQCN